MWTSSCGISSVGRLLVALQAVAVARGLRTPHFGEDLEGTVLRAGISMTSAFAWEIPVDGSILVDEGGSVLAFKDPHPPGEAPRLKSPATAMLARPLAAPHNYGEILIEDVGDHNAPFVGVTAENLFEQGYFLRGLMYGHSAGNLADGSSLLKSNWGPGLKKGDRVGVLLERPTPGRAQVYFFQNGQPLGLAYDVELATAFPDGEYDNLFLVVSGTGPMRIRFDPTAAAPAGRERPTPVPGPSIVGEWALESFTGLNLTHPFTMIVRHNDRDASGGQSFRVSMRVANMLNGVVELDGDRWMCENMATTRMMGPKELMRIENAVMSIFISKPRFAVSGAGAARTLELTIGEKDTEKIQAVFRATTTPAGTITDAVLRRQKPPKEDF